MQEYMGQKNNKNITTITLWSQWKILAGQGQNLNH